MFTMAYGIKRENKEKVGKEKIRIQMVLLHVDGQERKGGGLGLYNNLLGSKQDNSFVGKSNINFFG